MHRFNLPLLFILLLVLSLSLVPFPIRADNPIQVTNQAVESRYGQSITFRITATSAAGKIVYARLLRQTGDEASRSIEIADGFVPASRVDLKFTWDIRSRSLPPWQSIRYVWEISDDAGNTLTTPFVDAEYTHTTHPWKMLTDNKVRVYWYGMSDVIGKELFQMAQKGYGNIAKAINFEPDREIRVVLFPNHKAYLSFYATGTHNVEEWIGGQTYGTLAVLWYDPQTGNYTFTFQIVVPHEIAHAFLFARLSGHNERVPVWFNERQAVNNELVGVPSALANVGLMARTNKLFRLYDMENYANWGTDLRALANWYDEAASLVNFLYRQYGVEILGKLLKRINDGERFEEALKNETGWSLLDYEIAWRASLGARPLTAKDIAPTSTLEMPSFRPTPNYEVTATP